jgi:hypothetical protein
MDACDSDSDDDVCPLCCEELDLSDKHFLPCPCGYRVCMWCWHHIKDDLNGLCPACRTPYSDDPHAFSAVDKSEVIKSEKAKKKANNQARGSTGGGGSVRGPVPSVAAPSLVRREISRKDLHHMRVIQVSASHGSAPPSPQPRNQNSGLTHPTPCAAQSRLCYWSSALHCSGADPVAP